MSNSYVDWEFAKTTGRTLVAAGPSVSSDEAAAEVEAIRAAARRAHGPVAETSRLSTPDGAPEALVIDRPTWIAMNADSMGAMLNPAFEQIVKQRNAPSGVGAAIGGKVTGAEAGALLAFMSSKVLGQYDLAPGGTPALLLVAPNLVQVQRELDVDAEDFRAWVCMHEETHRVQFTAVPWLREHMIEQARKLATDMAPDQERIQELTRRITEKLPELFSNGSGGITDLVTTPEQRAKLAELTAVMSLLEGHADVVMDDVGPAHIPTVAQIRAKFTERRKGAGAVDKMLRRLLGLEAKMRQYKDGAAFVRGVHERVGVDGFNAVWTSPETLPKPLEITDPAAWVTRVHG
ncbi:MULTISPECIES: zinc-dependent metalloprotease [unclassified Knoellia]|uniref:zinc-dependent metalloprotease n=1 Tax=Knoellia altitudinis TaxID=3404795 RepID=UPI003613F29F